MQSLFLRLFVLCFCVCWPHVDRFYLDDSNLRSAFWGGEDFTTLWFRILIQLEIRMNENVNVWMSVCICLNGKMEKQTDFSKVHIVFMHWIASGHFLRKHYTWNILIIIMHILCVSECYVLFFCLFPENFTENMRNPKNWNYPLRMAMANEHSNVYVGWELRAHEENVACTFYDNNNSGGTHQVRR